MGLKVCLVCLEERKSCGEGGISKIKVLLSYLLGNKIEDGEGIKSDLLELSGECGELGLCEKCGVGAEQLLKLHLELEKVQMRIGYELKLIKGKVRSGEVQEKMKTLGGMERLMTEGGRKMFGGLKAFQNCVGEDNDINVPIVLLERCDLLEKVLEEGSAPKIERVTPDREHWEDRQIKEPKNEQPYNDITLLSPQHFEDPDYFEAPSPISERESETHLLDSLKSAHDAASKAKGRIEGNVQNCSGGKYNDANMSPYILLERCDLVRKVPADNYQTSSPVLDNSDTCVGVSPSNAHTDTNEQPGLPHPKKRKKNQLPAKSSIQPKKATWKEIKGNASELAEGRFQCKKCQKILSNRAAFYQHFHAIHLRTPVKCRFCDESFVHLSSLSIHQRRCHQKKLKKTKDNGVNKVPDDNHRMSPQRGEDFDAKKVALKEIKENGIELDDGRFQCKKCQKVVSGRVAFYPHYRIHLRMQHKIDKTKVSEVPVHKIPDNFPTPSPRLEDSDTKKAAPEELKEHGIKLADGRIQCKKCQKELSWWPAFYQHFRSMHLRIEHKCPFCIRSFVHLSSFRKHRRSCLQRLAKKAKRKVPVRKIPDNYPTSSPQLDDSDSKKEALEEIKENAISLAEGRVQCKKCQKEVSNRVKFYQHFRAMHLRIEHKCPFCNKQFVHLCSLKNHRRNCQHSDTKHAAPQKIKENGIELAEGRIQCKKCQMELSSRNAFYLHFRAMHLTTENKCPFCDKLFVHFSKLRLHRKKCQRKQPKKGRSKGYKAPRKITSEVLVSEIPVEVPVRNVPARRVLVRNAPDPDQIKIKNKKSPKYTMQPKESLTEIREHLKKLYGKRKFQCKKCRKRVTTLASFYQHYHAIHLKTERKCLLCGESFLHLSSFKRHGPKCEETQGKYKREVKEPKRKLPYKCTVATCDKAFSCPSFLLKHYKVIHPEEEPPKEVIQRLAQLMMNSKTKKKELENISEKYEAIKNEDGSEGFKCKECSGNYSSFKAFTGHYRRVHIKGEFKCELCNSTFVTRNARKHHERFCKNSGVFQCKLCDKSFGNPSSLTVHKRKFHFNFASFKCNSCGRWLAPNAKHECKGGEAKIGNEPIAKIKEKGEVLEGGRVKCKLCPKEVENLAIFFGHYAIHHSRIFQCKFCKKVIGTHPQQKIHEAKCLRNPERSQNKFQCDKCPKSYTDKTHLRRHFEINHVETFSRFMCDQCPSSFIEKYALKMHVKNVHEGNLPRFACQYCAKSSIYKKTIITHELKCPDRPVKVND